MLQDGGLLLSLGTTLVSEYIPTALRNVKVLWRKMRVYARAYACVRGRGLRGGFHLTTYLCNAILLSFERVTLGFTALNRSVFTLAEPSSLL